LPIFIPVAEVRNACCYSAFRDEVSPRFEYATEVMTAEVSSGNISSLRRLPVPGKDANKVYSFILSIAPEAVICGGIHPCWQIMFERERIALIWGVIGRAEDALELFAAGRLNSNQFVCSGRRVDGKCRRCGKRMRGRRFHKGGVR